MKRIALLICTIILVSALLAGCAQGDGMPKLDPDNPITITIWHYYNGAVLNTFEAAVTEFNETVGMERGIIAEIYGFGHPNDLESAVIASANLEIGSMPIPNVFASYADTAYAAERLGLLADLSSYFTVEELAEYVPSYIEEGRIGTEGEFRIFPVAKSTEALFINETDWAAFASDSGISYDDLATVEGLTRVAGLYYDWSGGKALFGRDSRANMFIIAAKQLGSEIFEVDGYDVTINADREIMRKIWDNYYVPLIKGHFMSYGRFSSDDARVGDILAYVGSTSSAAYFPTEVTIETDTLPESHAITAAVLPAPVFEGGQPVMVQQGAGMVVTNSTPETEYACAVFLKWFTDIDVNVGFAALSGYMPVKLEALDYELIRSVSEDAGIALNPVTDEALRVALSEMARSELYTSKAFSGGVEARAVLENNLQDKALADRDAVVQLIESGFSYEEAVAMFDNDENFDDWYEEIVRLLNNAANG